MTDKFTFEYLAKDPAAAIKEQIETYESTNGAEGSAMNGIPIVLLRSIGAKSGEIRKVPVMRVEHDGVHLVVGSLGGAPKDPAWVANLRVNPVFELRDKDQVQTVRAEEVTDPQEREVWWERAVAAYPSYQDYTTKTDRVFPIFTLTPVS